MLAFLQGAQMQGHTVQYISIKKCDISTGEDMVFKSLQKKANRFRLIQLLT